FSVIPNALAFILISIFPISAQDSPIFDSTETTLQQQQLPIADIGGITVTAKDTPDDNGMRITVQWSDPGYQDMEGFTGYEISRHKVDSLETSIAGKAVFGQTEFVDEKAPVGQQYAYRVAALIGEQRVESGESNPASSVVQWFNWSKISVVVIGLLVCGAVIYFIETAKRGKKLFLRRIAGLEAIDEAVGRATEMGRPVLFVAGTQDMDDVQTLAGLTILSRVSRTIAQYDSKINMPCRSSLVMTAGREMIKESYTMAGRPDAYSDDMVHYTTDEQFGFVAAVNGIMVREKPATCFYLGAFFAESLILAETGNSIDAIQIAGTAMPAQLPFFVAACDYTLIGEELFAASAYLSNEPRQLGSLKGQDVGKAVAMAAIVIGVIAVTLDTAWNIESMKWLGGLLHRMFSIS
ncbi:MAG: fibronectin type III domain-containing protein, partial [Candidatus Zixiibacteriota bacterium]